MSFNTNDRDTSGWSANAYQSAANYVYSPKYTESVLGLLDARLGECVADFGCGSGEVTRDIVSAVGPAGEVVAIDFSSSMIAKAKLATGLPDTHVLIGDLQSPTMLADARFPAPLIGRVDKVFTSATFHWCSRDPRTVLLNAARVLKPGGLIAGEFGGFGNVATIRSTMHAVLTRRGIDAAARDPWYFPSVEEYASMLASAGFTPVSMTLHPRPSPAHSLADWVRTFTGHNFLAGLAPEEERAIVDEVVRECEQKFVRDADGKWPVDHVRLRFVATKRA